MYKERGDEDLNLEDVPAALAFFLSFLNGKYMTASVVWKILGGKRVL